MSEEPRVSTGGWVDDYTTLHWFDCPWCGFTVDYGSDGYTSGDRVTCPKCENGSAVVIEPVVRKVEQ